MREYIFIKVNDENFICHGAKLGILCGISKKHFEAVLTEYCQLNLRDS